MDFQFVNVVNYNNFADIINQHHLVSFKTQKP